jgi:hypothetical protein
MSAGGLVPRDHQQRATILPRESLIVQRAPVQS